MTADALGPFHRGAALVNAAVGALGALPDAVEALAALLRARATAPGELVDALGAPRRLIEAATSREGRNLLVRRPEDAARFLVFGLVRRASGAVGVQPIEIDLAAVALVETGVGALDRLEAAVLAGTSGEGGRAAERERLAALRARVDAATSRLSIVKARLDLQTSFLAAMFAPQEMFAPRNAAFGHDTASDHAAPPVSLASDLDQAGARRMALDVRRMLDGRGLGAGGVARTTVRDLLES